MEQDIATEATNIVSAVILVFMWLCLVICLFCWFCSSWYDGEELTLVDDFWSFLRFFPSEMNAIYHVSGICPQWFKDHCTFLANLPTYYTVLCVLGIRSHFPSRVVIRDLVAKCGPQQPNFEFHSAQYKCIAISKGLTRILLCQGNVTMSCNVQVYARWSS